MLLLVIINPVAGNRAAERIWSEGVLPLVADFVTHYPSLSLDWDVRTTTAPGDGAVLVADALSQDPPRDKTTYLLLIGGDGTTHEALNGLVSRQGAPAASKSASTSSLQSDEAPPPDTHIALIPAGTANALYARLFPSPAVQADSRGLKGEHAWRLLSLQAFLTGLVSTSPEASAVSQEVFHRAHRVPLTLLRNYLTGVDASFSGLRKAAIGGNNEVLISHVVSSHALHASILADSDSPELRDKYPGIERFQIAAKKNLTRWVNGPPSQECEAGPVSARTGEVKILPFLVDERQTIQRYDPQSRTWVDATTSSDSTEGTYAVNNKLVLKGPFFYFAALLTDRLEPTFVPAPFSAPLLNSENSSSKPANHQNDSDKQSPKEWSDLCKSLSRPAEAVDIVIIRPLRDPSIQALVHPSSDQSQAKAAEWFAGHRVGPITEAMYKEGRHVHLTYPPTSSSSNEGHQQPKREVIGTGQVDERVPQVDGPGKYIVEYYRTGGYIWSPVPHSGLTGQGTQDPRSRAICVDGTIRFSDRADVRVLSSWKEKVGVWV